VTTYAVYNVTTGIILRRLECSPDDAAANCQAGEAIVECDVGINDETHVVNITQNPPIVIDKPPPSPSEALAAAKTAKTASLTAAYNAAILAPVSYTTAAGATALFNQAASDIENLNKAILGSQASGTWPLNLWQDATGAVVTPFTYADLQGLAAAFEAHDVPEYAHLLALLAEVTSAADLAAVAAINW
jgi:hypothetical protein